MAKQVSAYAALPLAPLLTSNTPPCVVSTGGIKTQVVGFLRRMPRDPMIRDSTIPPAETCSGQDEFPQSSKLRVASYDGKWTGTIKCLYDPGLWPNDESDIGLTFEIQGTAFLVKQVVRSKKGEETQSDINPGKFRFFRLATNAVAISIDTGKDEDGTWVETWSFAMTLKEPDHMIVHWTRIVNNVDMPMDKRGSKFSSVDMGEIIRSGPAI